MSHTATKRARSMHSRSSKYLRRARHLYCLFIRRACEQDEKGWMLVEAALQAKERGLYAKATLIYDVQFSIVRQSFNRQRRINPKYNEMFGWSMYRHDYGWTAIRTNMPKEVMKAA